MRIGVFCGDRWHPASVVSEELTAIEARGIEWEFITETIGWTPEGMDRYAAIVLCKVNCVSPTDPAPWLTESVQRAFLSYVERGGGLLVIHAGTVGYSKEPLFRGLIGGGFVRHPAPCLVDVETVGDSPIGERSSPFSVTDEHYFMELFNDDLNVFLTSRSEHGVQPAGWTRQQGKGRVCVLTPGHFAEVWQHPEYRRIIKDALEWCLGEGGMA